MQLLINFNLLVLPVFKNNDANFFIFASYGTVHDFQPAKIGLPFHYYARYSSL